MVRGMLLSLRRHKWWYPIEQDKGDGSGKSAQDCTQTALRMSDFRVKCQGPKPKVLLPYSVTLGRLS